MSLSTHSQLQCERSLTASTLLVHAAAASATVAANTNTLKGVQLVELAQLIKLSSFKEHEVCTLLHCTLCVHTMVKHSVAVVAAVAAAAVALHACKRHCCKYKLLSTGQTSSTSTHALARHCTLHTEVTCLPP
jgi:hypothetical protein